MDSKKVTLAEIQDQANEGAQEKGFNMGGIADTAMLEFPFGMGLLLIEQMAAIEHHRRTGSNELVSGNTADEMGGALARFKAKYNYKSITPGQKYMVAKYVLIVTEVAEAIEALLGMSEDTPKTSQPLTTEESADIVIRAIGMKNDAAEAGVSEYFDVAQAVVEKMAYNKSRPHKHGNKLY